MLSAKLESDERTSVKVPHWTFHFSITHATM